ncbi:putative pumilio-like protein 7 [Hibiscus syriacus]|uniref:Pumilio-like protein 7 n=1 Tax=Hibiscus syriacus TaxID=106335 RepID=A0A6A3AEX9_HIBSY|nr:putative pumilio-like protein 7 [Hibiscus syriacus]
MLESTAEKKKRGNMDDDDEFETILDEIPHATSHHHQNESFNGMYGLVYDDDPSSYFHNHTHASPGSGFSLLSDGSSSSLSNGSPPPPPLDDLKPHLSNGLFMDSTIRQKASIDCLFGELDLCRTRSKMYISNDQENFGSSFRDFSLEPNGIRKHGACDELRKGFADFVGLQSPVSMSVPSSVNGGRNMAFSGFPQQEYPQMYLGRQDALGSPRGMNNLNGTMRSPWQKKELACNYYQRGNSLNDLLMNDALIYGQRNSMNGNDGRGKLNFHASPWFVQANRNLSIGSLLNWGLPLSNGLSRSHSNVGIPNESSFIIQGDGLNFVINKGQEIGASKHREGRLQLDNWSHFAAASGNAKNAKLYNSFSLPAKCNSLAEARGYIYLMAKDQHGCRFLQLLFDEGTLEDVEIIFKEIIDHVVELMMNPFGNYLMQKLLEVCNEEQRMQILLMATEEPGQLVKISLNTHGTRVVQKLIETLKTRQQISLIISSLEPGFLSLIKDLNGNHVVQRCLQCLSCEDNKEAMHHFACVSVIVTRWKIMESDHFDSLFLLLLRSIVLILQLINTAVAFCNDALVIPLGNIGKNWLNKYPPMGSYLHKTRNYGHLSSQKFSSHVVEKCLVVLNDESRSKIINELLSTTHFERLLQDPHANYVVQTALRVSEGALHNSLVEAIESHKALSRNSPYSKRILSQKLLRK